MSSPPSVTPKAHSGIALVTTILILAMCFASLLSVLSLSSLSLKRGGKTQYHGYQALLAAESGMNSFSTRASLKLFDSSTANLSLDTLNNWLLDNRLDELVLFESQGIEGATNIKNTLHFSRLSTQSVTLESIGIVENILDNGEVATLAKKVLKTDFKLYAAGSRLHIQPMAAISTLGSLNLQGNTQLKGAASQENVSLIRHYDVARAHPTPLPNSQHAQLRIQHPNRFHSGNYIELTSGRYKVTTVDYSASSLELLPLTQTASYNLDDNEIALIPFALKSALLPTEAASTIISLSTNNTSNLALGQEISIEGNEAIVESITENDIAIRWTGTLPQETLSEGSIVSVGVVAAQATENLNLNGNAIITGGSKEQAKLTSPSLFETTFGLTKDELLGPLNTYNQRSGKSFHYHIGPVLNSFDTLNGLLYTEDALNFTHANPLCGQAILIAAVDVAVHAVCDEGFSGLLYVFGHYQQTGGHIDGAVVSEEARALPSPSATPSTTASSTSDTQLSGQASISYNAEAINQWQAHLQDEIANQDGKQLFQAIAGSWRLE